MKKLNSLYLLLVKHKLHKEADMVRDIIKISQSQDSWLDYAPLIMTDRNKDIPHGMFKILGKGSSRITFSIAGVSDKVVKVQYAGSDQNEKEFKLGKDHPELFPVAYNHGKSEGYPENEYGWIVQERVVPLIKSGKGFKDFFPKAYEIWKDLGPVEESELGAVVSINDMFHTFDYFIQSILEFEEAKKSNLEVSLSEEIYKKVLNSEPLIKKLIEVGTKEEIALGDLDPNNMGVSKDGRLVILDVG